MSRFYTSRASARHHQPLFSGPRNTQRKSHPDDTYQEKPQKKRRGGAKQSITSMDKSRGKKAVVNISEDESTSSGDEADAEDDEEEDEQPAAVDPPYSASRRTAGPSRKKHVISDDEDNNLSETDASMFGLPEFDDFDDYQKAKRTGAKTGASDQEFSQQLLALGEEDDDDDVYQGVEDISDSDIDPDSVERADQRAFEENIQAMYEFEDQDSTWDIQNHIEGMSAYGFGGSDSEGTLPYLPSGHSSDAGPDAVQRHVRFEDNFPEKRPFVDLADSPTMSRALLPSALPGTSLTEDLVAPAESEDTDSDLTDECLPDISLRTPKPTQSVKKTKGTSSESETQKKTPKLKGPPSGTFIDDGVKSAGILDPSGKMLIITNPHCLGEEFAKRYAASAPQSPSKSFAEVVFDDNASQVSQSQGSVIPDPMLSSLTTGVIATANGQVEGPPYAFFAQPSDYSLALDVQHDDFDDSEYAGLSPHEAAMNLEDVIEWGSDSDDDAPMSPLAMSVKANATPRQNGIMHLTTSNVMSFRRNADPAFAALQSSPLAPHYRHFSTPKVRPKKRKARTDSPYNHAHYHGVTPVQRMPRSAEHDVSNGSPGPSSKRLRLMT